MRENSTVNVLAQRYASQAMRDIWSPQAKIIAERRLWIAVMRAQSSRGLSIPDSVISDYEKVVEKIDLESIDQREKKLRHDVKARIEEFNALAGHEAIHAGMTSRDLTENIEAWQVKSSLSLVHERVIALLSSVGKRAIEYKNLPIAEIGRAHV